MKLFNILGSVFNGLARDLDKFKNNLYRFRTISNPSGNPMVGSTFKTHSEPSLLTAPFLSSVQFSHSVVSDSLRPHESQHARPPCPSPSPGVHSDSRPSSPWCHHPSSPWCPPAISSSWGDLLLLPLIPPSIRVFSNESILRMRWPKYWSFSFSISPSKEIPGLISFRMDWLDLLAVQGTLKNLLQHHSSKASIIQCSAFFTVQLSHPYMTTGKTIALTRRTLVGQVIFLLLNILSRLVVIFLPRSKCLLM